MSVLHAANHWNGTTCLVELQFRGTIVVTENLEPEILSQIESKNQAQDSYYLIAIPVMMPLDPKQCNLAYSLNVLGVAFRRSQWR